MTNLEKAVISILNNNLIEGKKLIESSLYEKMGQHLEQRLMEFAPTVFNEKMDPVGDEDEDVDNDGDSDDSDNYLKKRREAIFSRLNLLYKSNIISLTEVLASNQFRADHSPVPPL